MGTRISAIAAIAAAAISATDGVPGTDMDALTPTSYLFTMAAQRTALLAQSGSGWTATDYLSMGASPPSTGRIRLDHGTITSASPLLSGIATWNSGAVAFTGLLVNITDTASDAASLLVDLQVGGTSKFKVSKAGLATLAGGITVSSGTATLQALAATSGTFTAAVAITHSAEPLQVTHSGVAGTNSFAKFTRGATVAGYIGADASDNLTLARSDGTVAVTINRTTGALTTATTINGQTISSAANFTGTVVVAGGTTLASLATPAAITSTAQVGIQQAWGNTSHAYCQIYNTDGVSGGNLGWGVESVTGGHIFTGTAAYAAVFGTSVAKSLQLVTNNVVQLSIASSGVITVPTRFIGGTDIASAIAKGVFGDGNYSATTDAAITAVVGSVTSYKSSNASGTWINHKTQIVQDTASSGSAYASHNVAQSTHTTGTLAILRGITGAVYLTGSGGTTSSAAGLQANVIVSSGAIATSAYGLKVEAASISGTVATAYGIEIGNVSGATTNYALKTGTGLVQFGDLLVTVAATSARSGFRLSSGSTPIAPVDGDLWSDGSQVRVRLGGVTQIFNTTPI